MLAALGTLIRDGWVIGIACAASLAYAVVNLLEDIIYVVLTIIDGPEYTGDVVDELLRSPYTVVVNGHLVYLLPVLGGAILLIIVVGLAAFALHATREPAEKPSS